MQTVGQIIVGILCLSIVGLTWAMIQKFTNLMFNSASLDTKQEWKELGIGVAVTVGLVAVAGGIAALAGI